MMHISAHVHVSAPVHTVHVMHIHTLGMCICACTCAGVRQCSLEEATLKVPNGHRCMRLM
jgi:hypothetical protein